MADASKYRVPGTTVSQNMTSAPVSSERNQPAFIIGPNYLAHRYANADEKASTGIGNYTGLAMSAAYPGALDPDAVDTGFTRLYGDNVVVQLADLTTGATLPETVGPTENANGGYNKIFSTKTLVSVGRDGAAVALDAVLKRPLAAGDTLAISYATTGGGSGSLITSVASAEYDSTGFDVVGDSDLETAGGSLVVIEDVLPLGCTLSAVKLCEVQNGVIFGRKNLQVGAGYLWSESESAPGISVSDDLYAAVTGFGDPNDTKYQKVLYADLFLTYRELVTTYSDTIHSVGSAGEVESVIGTPDKDNPLALGVYMASLNTVTDDGNSSAPVYFMAVPSDDLKGYNAVLKAATLTKKVYTVTPMTDDGVVIEAVRAHVTAMSAKNVKRWRIGAVSKAIPEEVATYSAAGNPAGGNFYAIPVSPSKGTLYSEDASAADKKTYTMLRVVESPTSPDGSTATAFKKDVRKGDIVRFRPHKDSWGETAYDGKAGFYRVLSVVSNNTIELAEPVDLSGIAGTGDGEDDDAYYTPSAIEIWHPYAASEVPKVVQGVSEALGTRRLVNIYPNRMVVGGDTVPGFYGAAAVAGIVSAMLPQQPMTNLSVRGIDSVPLVYSMFDEDGLNEMAAGGTFVICQSDAQSEVLIRHQITTAYPDGNINTGEISITKNVDDVSYRMADVVDPKIGKTNITEELLRVIRNEIAGLLAELERSDGAYGPQLILYDLGDGETELTRILYVRQNALYKDHVDVGVRLGVPYPCNYIDVELTV